MSYKSFLEEALIPKPIEIPDIPNTMTFYHGGNLDDYDETVAHKKGRYEFGAGLYLTTHYGTAARYAKGSRKLYLVTVERGNDSRDALLDWSAVDSFLMTHCVKSKRNEVVSRIRKYINTVGKVRSYIVVNVLLNEAAIKPSQTPALRTFLVDNGVDYEIVDNAFGWGEKMLVLYNMKKIVKLQRVDSRSDVIDMLPLEWK
jgi:hypothetical protein